MPTISNLTPLTTRKRSTKAPKTTRKAAAGSSTRPDPEVRAKPKRRTFTAAYKRRVVEEAERMTSTERGAYLRRQGLYSSHFSEWRKLRDRGMLDGVRKRGRKGKDPILVENERLKRRLARAEQQLRQAEACLRVQKKVSELLGISLETPALDESSDDESSS